MIVLKPVELRLITALATVVAPETKNAFAMNIVFLSHSAFHPSMVVGSHQLARSYAQSGHRVLHISLPFSLGHSLRFVRRVSSAELTVESRA